MILFLSLLLFASPPSNEGFFYAVAETDSPNELKSLGVVQWWIEAPGQLLMLINEQGFKQLSEQVSIARLDVPVKTDLLRLVSRHHHNLPQDAVELISGGRFAVVQGEDLDNMPTHGHSVVLPFVPNTVLAKRLDLSVLRSRDADPAIQDLVDQVNGPRWYAAVEQLSNFNRWTHGAGIHDARDWLVSKFEELPNMEVSTPSFNVGGTTAFNVVARLPGTGVTDAFFIVGAHYDATSQIPQSQAPGAEDNGSGTAAVLEMARIFSADPPVADVYFICYSGEEEGLHGSVAHASGLVSAGTDKHCQMALIMDMIGYTSDGTLETLLETSSAFASLLEPFSQAAATYTSLDVVTSLNPFGSDHVPYLQRGMPSLLTIENDWAIYPDYHRATDLPENVTIAMGRETIKMNVAVLAEAARMEAVATLADYLAAWGGPVEAPLTDHYANGLVDILDILRSNVL